MRESAGDEYDELVGRRHDERLDSEHRSHLIERYFPNASHQVLILSTDTEVDRANYDQLRPFISRAYHLNYDESRKLTVPEEGYFWQTASDP